MLYMVPHVGIAFQGILYLNKAYGVVVIFSMDPYVGILVYNIIFHGI
jgi:hypothetical protein